MVSSLRPYDYLHALFWGGQAAKQQRFWQAEDIMTCSLSWSQFMVKFGENLQESSMPREFSKAVTTMDL